MHIHLENNTTNKTLSFGQGDTPYAINQLDIGVVSGEHNTTKYINLNGSYVNKTSLGVRDVTLTGWIFATSDAQMKERKEFLNKFFNPRQEISIYYNEYALIVRPDASIKYSTEKYENRTVLCKWIAQCTAFNPLWRLKHAKVYREARTVGVPIFPLIIPEQRGFSFGYMPATSVTNVPNFGDVDAGFVLRFIAEEGQVINPKIVDNKTQKYIEIIVDMNIGDIVEISTMPGDKYAKLIKGQSEIDIFKSVTKQSSMDMALSVGVNDLTINAVENAVNLATSISFSPEWLEVQT